MTCCSAVVGSLLSLLAVGTLLDLLSQDVKEKEEQSSSVGKPPLPPHNIQNIQNILKSAQRLPADFIWT